MIAPLSANAQAILLLTAPLVAGRKEASPDLLALGEYNRLAHLLREKQKQPGDLIRRDAPEVVNLCTQMLGRARLEALLGRGFLLSQAIDRWQTRAIWVVTRADAAYPRRLKARLREDAPPVLYGCGDEKLLQTRGFAVVGSRHVNDEQLEYTERIGRLAAAARLTLVSGAARGIDRAAMRGALQAGGAVAGVMSDSLEQAALARDNREGLMDQRLVLVSPYDPSAGFNVGHAMQRNKLIYALADVALVVTSEFGKGGTWAGAVEQLERLHFVPVFVRNSATSGDGNAALLQRGGLPWPDPHDDVEFNEALVAATQSAAGEAKQGTLSFVRSEELPAPSTEIPAEATSVSTAPTPISEITESPAEQLFATVRAIVCRELDEPRTEAELAGSLQISRAQAKAWLIRLIGEGAVEKLSRPVRYRTTKSSGPPRATW